MNECFPVTNSDLKKGRESNMNESSYLAAILGGAMIGLSASIVLLVLGRVAGISNILADLLSLGKKTQPWVVPFVLGLVVGGVALFMVAPSVYGVPAGRSLYSLLAAGLLVGFGSRMGSGCTSGHGICGLSRMSVRSLVATLTFMATGFMTATTISLLQGSAS
jgi:uncharacterized protein